MFTTHEIRRAMDVYTADGACLGNVLWTDIVSGRQRSTSAVDASSIVSGESLGPGPTWDIGNRGPATQSAEHGFAAELRGRSEVTGLMVGKWWGLAGRWWIPADIIAGVALERVLLTLNAADLRRYRAS